MVAQRRAIPWILWTIWKNGNEVLYVDTQESIVTQVQQACEEARVVSEGRVGPRPAVERPLTYLIIWYHHNQTKPKYNRRPTQISIQRWRSIPSPLKKSQKNIFRIFFVRKSDQK